MKTYVKPDISVNSLYSSPVANDPFDINGDGNEVEISSNDWFDILS